MTIARPARLAVVLAALAAAGCGGSRYPVEGRVLLNGQPLKGKAGAVALRPDASKGNKHSVSPVGVRMAATV